MLVLFKWCEADGVQEGVEAVRHERCNRKKANVRWIEYSDGDRSELGLRCVVRVLEAAPFYGLILTALASFELPCRQAQEFGGVHACGGQCLCARA